MLQLKVVHMAENSKYTPLKDIGIGGIIVMRYGNGDQPEELVEPVSGKKPCSSCSATYLWSHRLIVNHYINFLFFFSFFFFFMFLSAMGPKVEEEAEPEPPEPFEYTED